MHVRSVPRRRRPHGPTARHRRSSSPRSAPYVPAVAIIVFQLIVYPLPAGVWLLGFVLGMLGLAGRARPGARLPGQPDHQLRPGRPRHRADPFASACIASSRGPAVPAVVRHRPRRAVILGALVEFLLIRRFFKAVAPPAHRGDHRPVAAAHRGRAADAADLGPADHRRQDHRVPVAPRVHGRHPALRLRRLISVLVVIAVLVGLAAVPAPQRHRHRRAGQRRARRPGRHARHPGEAAQDARVGDGRGLSFIGVFLRASILGLPLNPTLSLSFLLAALTALILGGADCLPAVALSAVALGVPRAGRGLAHRPTTRR